MNDLTKKLSRMLSYELPNEFTSVSYAIMIDGRFVASDTLGTTGGKKPVPADSRCTYNVASISKIFCSVAVMQLVEKGLLDLDASVIDYVPEFTMPDERYKKITLRHCLSHSCALPGTQWKGFSVTEPEDEDYYSEFLEYVGHSYLKAEPGYYSTYCNDGFTLAEMAVKNVSGMPYHEYCLKHICKPLGLESSRLIYNLNPEYTLIAEKKGPAEKLLIQGGAGFTSNMEDICRLGSIFLNKGAGILGEASIKEMGLCQGKTFLDVDERSCKYGLGWDQVAYANEDFDLGEGVLTKGGNSFQFTSQLIVIPKYNASLAIAETHDCNLNVQEMILKLFAVWMAEEKGVNIRRKSKLPSKAAVKRFEGMYTMPTALLDLAVFGPYLYVVGIHRTGLHYARFKALTYDGKGFAGPDVRIEQTSFDGETYLTFKDKITKAPLSQKLKADRPLTQAWKARFGRPYIVDDINANDIVIQEILTGFMMSEIEEYPGNIVLSFSGSTDSGVYGPIESTVRQVTDDVANGFLLTPSNPSRDLLTPMFEVIDGVSYCHAASYVYKDCTEALVYTGQTFEELKEAYAPKVKHENVIFRVKKTLHKLPKVPEGGRLMVLDDKLCCVWDSLTSHEKFTKIKSGWLHFVL
jgi:Beta-lactamase class C and other penicillin binding proteins